MSRHSAQPVTLSWSKVGTASPLLLIQGLGYPAEMWFRLAPLLASHHTVITFDNRGIGRNGALDVSRLTIESMAADAASVIEETRGGSAHVLGTSLGGIVAQELALARPDLVQRLVLLSTHTADEHAILADEGVRRMLVTRSQFDQEASLRASVPYAYAASTPAALIEEDLARRARWSLDPAAYDAQLNAAAIYRGTWERLPQIRHETLVIHGTEDQIVPVENSEVITGRIPQSRLVRLEGGGHNLFSERADEIAPLVVGFLGC